MPARETVSQAWGAGRLIAHPENQILSMLNPMRARRRIQPLPGCTRTMMSTRRISVPVGGAGNPLTDQMVSGNILQFAGRLAEEVMVVVRVGIEVGAAGFDHRLAQKPSLGELV